MNTYRILKEWRNFLNENRIIPLSELLDIISSSDVYTDSDAKQLSRFWQSNQFSSKYSQVIKNDLLKGEPVDHIIDAVTTHYLKVYQTTGPKEKDEIGRGVYSADDLRKSIDARNTDTKRFSKKETRSQCNYQNGRPVVGKYKDFDVIYSERDWIVIEPKTIQGSIAWAHGKPDGSEETDQTRRVGWCTGVSTANNMFPNYAGNLHMFYLIKSDYDNVSGPDRRMCLSFTKNRNGVSLQHGDASVDANNSPLSQKYITKHIGENIVNLIKSLVEERKETSFSEIYSKITLTQLIRQIKQMKSQGISEEDFSQELSNYALYAKSEEVIIYLMTSFTEDYDLNFAIKSSISRRNDLSDFTGVNLINTLAKDEVPEIRAAVAESLNTPEQLLTTLSRDEDSNVRAAVALNSNTPEQLLTTLSRDEETKVRAAVAYNPRAPKEALLALSRDEEYTVKYTMIYNKATPKEVFLTLARDEDPKVRASLASSSNTPKEIFLTLARDEDPKVRVALASSSNTPKEVLLVLAKDEDPKLKSSMASNSNTPKEVLLVLAKDEDARIRSAVAANSNTPVEILLTLSKDEDKHVRSGVVKNRNAPEQLLMALTKDEDEYVRLDLALRSIGPKSVLLALANGEDAYVASRAKETLEDMSEKFLRSYIKLLLN